MNKGFILILVTILIVTIDCSSQSSNSYLNLDVLPDFVDNNFDFSNNILNKIDYSTGKIYPEIPITSISDHNYTVNVGIRYKDGSGVKVNEIASCTGLGFELFAGGYIKRTVRGIPDDLSGGWITLCNQGANYECNNWMTEYYPFSLVSNPTWNLEDYWDAIINRGAGTSIDGEADIYDFNLNGRTGKFVFDNEGKILLLPYQNIQVKPIFGVNHQANWELITEDGVRYIFYTFYPYIEQVTETANTGSPAQPTITTSYTYKWNLSKIILPSGNEINFDYATASTYEFTNENEARRDFIPTFANQTTWLAATGYNSSSVIDISSTYKFLWPKYISQISTEFGSINFIYSNVGRFPRKDFPNQFFLKEINKKLNPDLISERYTLTYSYFNSPGFTTPESYRLKLLNVTRKSISSNEKDVQIKFAYNENEKLPPRNSKMQDIFGFYNDNTTNILYPTTDVPNWSGGTTHYPGGMRLVNEAKTQAYQLNKIIFSKGYFAEFNFEQNNVVNDWLFPTANIPWGGVRVKDVFIKDLHTNSDLFHIGISYLRSDNNSFSSALASNLESISQMKDFTEIKWEVWNQQQSTTYTAKYMLRTGFPYKQCSFDQIRYANARIDYDNNGGSVRIDMTGFHNHEDTPPIRHDVNGNVVAWSGDCDRPREFYSDESDARGKINKISYYNSGGRHLKDKIFYYLSSNKGSCNNIRINARNFSTSMGQGREAYNISVYHLKSQSTTIGAFIEKEFDISGNEIMVQKNFQYLNPYITSRTSEDMTNSDGIVTNVTYKYPKDYMDLSQISPNNIYSNAIKYMQEHNMNRVIEEVFSTSTCSYCNPSLITGAKLHLYKCINTTNGSTTVAPVEDYVFTPLNPVNINTGFQNSDIQNQTGSYVFIMDPQYRISKHNDIFNSLGDLVETHEENSIHTSIKFDSQSRIIGTFSNCQSFYDYITDPSLGNECGLLNFESNHTGGTFPENDYWNVSNGSITSSTQHTGYMCQQLHPATNGTVFGAVRTFLPSNQYQKFKFSMWVRNSGNYSQNNGGALVIDVKHNDDSPIEDMGQNIGWQHLSIPNTNDEWKYVEFVFDLGEFKSQHNLHGEVLRLTCYPMNMNPNTDLYVDDIRFQPLTSACVSYTYNKYFEGLKESESDAISIPVYYEYDGLGRLRMIRNHKKFILKEITYDDGDYEFCNEEADFSLYKDDCANGYPIEQVNISIVENSLCSSQHEENIYDYAQNYANTHSSICTPCNTEGYKLINGICFMGTQIDEGCWFDAGQGHACVDHYHYYFPVDNSVSQTYTRNTCQPNDCW
jgi:hypothetical protein